MIVVCGTETSTTIRWSSNAVPCPDLPNADEVDATDTRTRTGVHGDSSNSQIRSLARLNPLTAHSTTQWGEECSGVNAVVLVSVLQTWSWMYVFNII